MRPGDGLPGEGLGSLNKDRRQIDCPSQTGATTLNPFLAMPFSRLARDRCMTSLTCSLFSTQAPKFGYVDQ